MTRLPSFRDERGTTLVELTVAIAAGMVILLAISTVIIVALRESNRVSARVDADRNARLAIYKVVDQLHSACIAPQIAPIQQDSTTTQLSFIHQTGSEVAPVPTLTKISLSGGALSQSDYASTGGTAPKWEFASTPYSTKQLMTGVTPTPPSTGIFSYYAYKEGQISTTPLTAAPLGATNAAVAVWVQIGFSVAPSHTPVSDPNARVAVQNSALLRLTPASFSTGANNLPCQ